MDLEIEKFVKKQKQLQQQVEELFAEKKKLQDKISVLNECLSLEKVKRKISELENKQKILTSLECMADNLRTELKPLEYLKQLLQRELMVSSLSTNDFKTKEKNVAENLLPTANSECANEMLDSLSDADSDDSIVVLSEYDVVSDEETINNTEKTVANKVLYEEALQMASSVHSSLAGSLTKNVESIVPLPNIANPINDVTCIQPNSKNIGTLINTSCKSEEILEMYDVLNKQDFLNCNENGKIKLECNTEKIVSSSEVNQLYILDETFGDNRINPFNYVKSDVISKILNDSWVKVDKNETLDVSIKSEPSVDPFQDNITFNVGNNLQSNELHNHQFDTKNICEMKSSENVIKDVKHNSENENHNSFCLINDLKFKIKIDSLNTEDSNSTVIECNKPKVNTKEEIIVLSNQLYNCQNDSKQISKVSSCENVFNDKNHNPTNTIYNSISNTNVSKEEIKINPSLSNTKSSNISIKCVDLPVNINSELYSITDEEKPTQSCLIDGIDGISWNVELLNGIHQYGFQNLTPLQLKCISLCFNGHDIIVHSYPCVGKSIMSFISVLQRIDTSINECQAIILVPTLELALSTQKIIKSIGKFLNVSTCIGGTNVPRKVSPVPHVVISTPCGLCDMINCNSLCKDFIKMLVIDDADEMFENNKVFNQLRRIILFLKKERQLIILTTSKFEEVLDLFSDTMQNPEYIIVPNEKPSLDNVSQYCVNVSEEWKFDAICELFDILNSTRTVVYCNTWSKCLRIAEIMNVKTYTVFAVHNEMETSQRQLILRQFRSSTKGVLITTGLLKGEDFSDVAWVINYDLPKSSKDYVRRIVGCFECRVEVINFITTNDITVKKNIETEFNVHMHDLPKNVTDFHVSNFNYL